MFNNRGKYVLPTTAPTDVLRFVMHSKITANVRKIGESIGGLDHHERNLPEFYVAMADLIKELRRAKLMDVDDYRFAICTPKGWAFCYQTYNHNRFLLRDQ